MNILFFTNIPSPYRVDFFNELGKYCNLVVCFERRSATDRDAKWVGDNAQNFKEEYLELNPYGASGSKGNGIVKYIKDHSADHIIFSGYASPSVRSAIIYCQLRKIPYFIEYDGGFNKRDQLHKKFLKRALVSKAEGHFITCDELRRYLLSLGVIEDRLLFYPFSSVKKSDVISKVLSTDEKKIYKLKVGIAENFAVISVGQFIYRKGFDILFEASKLVDKSVGIYIIGGAPTAEYQEMRERLGASNVHFVDFMTKEELKEWYLAADLFAFPTREDIWGLVVNEAMACGLPVVATDRCIAALELVLDGENGYVVPINDPIGLATKINMILNDSDKRETMSQKSLQRIAEYTIENMAISHIKHLESYDQGKK